MSPLLNSPINRSADQSSLSAWNKNQKGGRCLPFNLTHFTAAHQYFSTTVRKVNSTRVSISARPSSNIVNILPPAPGLRAVPSQAAAIARPSPSAPPKAAIPTANERSEEHTSELQSLRHLVCRLLLEKKKGVVTVSLR